MEVSIAKSTIVIGNATVGGGGKTPITLALAKLLSDKKKRVCIVSRGYKGTEQGPYWVQASDDAAKVGDEALLLAKKFPCIVSKDRRAAKQLIKEFGPDMILLDDGYQNPTIKKDFRILLADNQFGFGNNLLFPAGPLRMHVKEAILESDIVIVVKEDEFDEVDPNILSVLSSTNKKFFTAHPISETPISTASYLAFSGLAINEKFFRSLKTIGYKVKEEICFPDHFAYEEKDLINLIKLAKEKKLRLITTEKDAVKIPCSYLKNIEILPYQLAIQKKEELLNDIISEISKKS